MKAEKASVFCSHTTHTKKDDRERIYAVKRVIVTADDFGMCKYVDDAILELMHIGTLTSTNVLTNYGSLERMEELKKIPNVSVGIHWNITSGRPVSKPNDIPTLVDAAGKFYSLTEFKKRCALHKIREQDIETELRAQYELLYKTYGKTASYWNTHENSSHVKTVFNICCRLAKEYKIPATRIFDRVYLDFDMVKSFPRRMREYTVRAVLHNRYAKIRKDFKMPDARLVAFSNEIKTNIDRNRKAILSSEHTNIEMVIHPATDIDLELFGNIGQDRIREYELHKSKEMYDLLHNDQITAITFEDL